MKWQILFPLYLVMLATSCFAAGSDDQVRVGIRVDGRTIEYRTNANEPAGALIDLWLHWGMQHSKTIEFVFIDNEAGLDLLAEGRIDVLANSKADNRVVLSDPYFSYDFYLFSLGNSQRHAPTRFPLAVGVRKTDLDYLDRGMLAGARVKEYVTYAELVAALRASEIDYFLANDVSMNISISGLSLLRLNYPEEPFLTHRVRAAVSNKDARFSGIFNAGMLATVEDIGGAVRQRWLPGTAAFRLSWSLIGLALVIIVATGLLTVIWFMNAKLKDQVNQVTKTLMNDQELLREARNKAVDSELYIRNLIDAIHAVIIAINDVGNITHLNSYAKRFVPKGDAWVNRPFAGCFPFLKDYRNDLITIFEGKKPIHLRKVELLLNSDERIVANLAFLPFVVNGKGGALILIEDISEAAKNDELLLQSQKLDLIQSLAGGVAHDFNNVLAVINGSANLLRGHVKRAEPLDKRKLDRYLDNILNAAEKGVATTKGLASLSGRVSVDFDDFSMNLAVESIIQICSTTMDKSVQVHYSSPQQTLLVNGNRGLLEQALLNVVINAYHAMTVMKPLGVEQGGVLTISLELTGGACAVAKKELCIVIKDTGVGIAQEHLGEVCTPFYTTKKNGVGTGLGLAMVHNSLSQHDGRMEISSSLGIGTEVRLFLPCTICNGHAGASGEKSEEDGLDQSVRHGGVILLADDNDQVRDSIAENLSLYGYKVTQAKNGAELVEFYSVFQDQVDVVITDLEMPVMTGDKACLIIRELNPQAKIIIYSGFLEDDRIRNILIGGADDFIQKPCVVSELVSKIETLRSI